MRESNLTRYEKEVLSALYDVLTYAQEQENEELYKTVNKQICEIEARI